MDDTIAKRAKRAENLSDEEIALRRVGLAMCNAERKYFGLEPISNWDDLTDKAMHHYRRFAVAAIKAMK